MDLYIHRDGQQFGPYPAAQAQEYLASGDLRADDLAWHEGAAQWASLAEVLGTAAPAPAPLLEPQRDSSPKRQAAAWSPPMAAPAGASRGEAQAVGAPQERDPRTRHRRRSSPVNAIVRQQQSLGMRNMVWGGIWFLGGLAVTVGTYMASGSGGGTYVVAWGAILVGGIKLMKGAAYLLKK